MKSIPVLSGEQSKRKKMLIIPPQVKDLTDLEIN